MKKAKFISLRTRLFIILSALMGLILAVQFYLAYQAQQDLIDELNRLSNKINLAIDAHYAGVLQEIQESEQLVWKADSTKFTLDPKNFLQNVAPESLYTEVLVELKNIREKSQEIDSLQEKYDRKYQKEFRQHKKEKEKLLKLSKEKHLTILSDLDSLSETEEFVFHERVKPLLVPEDSLLLHLDEHPAPSIEMIDVNLNDLEKEARSVIRVKPNIILKKLPKEETKKVTFRFPDFSLPNQPKLIHYNYQASDIEEAINASLQRNILMTIVLFGLSMLLILLISHRFLKPIGVLQSSFKKVVNGNLDVSVPAKTGDEIGDLTISFNQMVAELRKNAEKEKILQRKERLASMGQLAAGVAHEIKNPLNAINLTIEHLGDKLDSRDKTVKKYIRTIQNEIGRLDGIVDNFLNFIRSESLNKADSDVHRLISEVLQLLETEIQSAKISVEFDENQPFRFSLDAERFKTVLLNIILNSIHAMPDGGRLQIRMDPNAKLITIEDSGAGIPKENLDKIFDLFYTTKSKGTGLGLPTAFKIVKEHGGDIDINSEVGRGTIVKVKLA